MFSILLSTYQGEKYLSQQLNSLFKQTLQNFHIIVRDDGSSDGTCDILLSYQKQYPEKITLLPSNKNLGVIQSFATLIQHAQTPYIFFCDQDDVWLPEKIEKTWKKMQDMEKQYGKETPLLIHTDLQVVDDQLRIISPSFWQYIATPPQERNTLAPLLSQNSVTGCATMINRPLQQHVRHIPSAALMHDHWLALVAAGLGAIGYLKEPTILYRQHNNNQIGAKAHTFHQMFSSFLNHGLRQKKIRFSQTFQQAHAFLKEYGTRLKNREIVEDYCNLPQCSRFNRCKITTQRGFWKSGGLIRKGLHLAFLLSRSI